MSERKADVLSTAARVMSFQFISDRVTFLLKYVK